MWNARFYSVCCFWIFMLLLGLPGVALNGQVDLKDRKDSPTQPVAGPADLVFTEGDYSTMLDWLNTFVGEHDDQLKFDLVLTANLSSGPEAKDDYRHYGMTLEGVFYKPGNQITEVKLDNIQINVSPDGGKMFSISNGGFCTLKNNEGAIDIQLGWGRGPDNVKYVFRVNTLKSDAHKLIMLGEQMVENMHFGYCTVSIRKMSWEQYIE